METGSRIQTTIEEQHYFWEVLYRLFFGSQILFYILKNFKFL